MGTALSTSSLTNLLGFIAFVWAMMSTEVIAYWVSFVIAYLLYLVFAFHAQSRDRGVGNVNARRD